MDAFTVKSAVQAGWTGFKSRPWLFIHAGLILLALNIIVSGSQNLVEENAEVLAGVPWGIVLLIGAPLVGAVASILMAMGETSFFLRAHDDVHTARLRDLWHPRSFLRFFLGSLLVGILVLLGLVLLIVPGIILGLALSFVTLLIIERNLGPIAAIKESARITKGKRWKLLLLGLANFGILILGIIALGVGLLVAIPVVWLSSVHAYRVLSTQAGEPKPKEVVVSGVE